MKLPALTKLSETPNQTKWKAQFPSTLTTQGGTYRVTTYPASDVIFIETWVTQRPCGGKRISAAILAAFDRQRASVTSTIERQSNAMTTLESQDKEALKKAINPASLRPYTEGWEQPDSQAVRAVLKIANLTGGGAAKLTGIADSRTVRRWTGGETAIPYAAWALLCEVAGLGKIWNGRQE
jgi:hypothetical protein